MSPSDALETALAGRDLVALADAYGIDPLAVGRAGIGSPISASHHLRICAALGLDPMTELRDRKPRAIGSLDHKLLAMGFKMRRSLNRHTARKAATVMAVSAAAVTRIELGHVTSIRTVLKACRYVGVHPFDYCRDVSRESTETRSAA